MFLMVKLAEDELILFITRLFNKAKITERVDVGLLPAFLQLRLQCQREANVVKFRTQLDRLVTRMHFIRGALGWHFLNDVSISLQLLTSK